MSLSDATPEELAVDELRIIKDANRIERMKLVQYVRRLIRDAGVYDEALEEELDGAFNNIVTVLALWKRNEVLARVTLRKLSKMQQEQ